jgi:surfactin synthase thioesterase subunit
MLGGAAAGPPGRRKSVESAAALHRHLRTTLAAHRGRADIGRMRTLHGSGDGDRVLVCLSYCGGGTAPFRRWGAALPDSVDLAPICYPGREGRYNTPFARDWTELLDDVLGTLRGIARRPYVLFGHSMGAWVAFEAAARMEALGLRPPEALVVSANDAPTRWEQRRTRRPNAGDTDAELLRWMREVGQLPAEILADADLCEMAVELLRADLVMSSTYRYRPGVRVSAPMQVIHGTTDPVAGAEAAQRWRELSTGPFATLCLPGGHFYTEELWAGLPRHLAGLMTAGAAH